MVGEMIDVRALKVPRMDGLNGDQFSTITIEEEIAFHIGRR